MGKGATTDLRSEASRQLDEGELTLAMAGGTGPSGRLLSMDFVIVTTKRVIIWDRGWFNKSTNAFDFHDIKSVHIEEGVFTGSLSFNIFGRTEHFEQMDKADAKRVGELIRTRMAVVRGPKAQAASPDSDPLVRLEKLASLLDKGILTKQEFEAQKRKLLE